MAATLPPETSTVRPSPIGRPEGGFAAFAERALAMLNADALCVLRTDPDTGAELPVQSAGDEGQAAALLDDRAWSSLPTIGTLATVDQQTCVGIDGSGRIRVSRTLQGDGTSIGKLKIVWPAGTQIDQRIDRAVSVLAQMASALYWTGSEFGGGGTSADPALVIATVMSELALTARSFEELVGGVTATTCTLLGAAKGGAAILHEHGSYLQMLPGSFGAALDFAASSQAKPSNPNSPAGRVTRSRRPWYTNDTTGPELVGIRDFLIGFGVETYMIAPLIIDGRVIGVTHVANKPGGFDDDDVRLLETVTTFVAAAVAHVSHRLRLKRTETIASVLRQTATTIAAGDPSPGFTSLLSEFSRAIDARVLAVSFTDGTPQIVARRDSTPLAIEQAFLGAGAHGVPTIRSDSRRPLAAGDLGWDAIHAPVLLGGSHEGTVSVLRVPSDPFTDEERQSVRRLANLVALAWATERYQQERAQMARLRERDRIADDLHDHVAQILFSAQLALETVLEEVDDQALSVPVARARDLLGRSEVGIREVIHRLSSPTPDDLGSRLAGMVQTVEEDFSVPVHLDLPPELEWVELSDAVTEVIVGAAREALINAAKHAGKCRISLSCRVGTDRLRVRVIDDGIGPISAPIGYGLQAHRRRLQGHGGTIRIERAPGRGTRVSISSPLDLRRLPEAQEED